MTYEKIIQDIQNRVFYPIYYLHGEEAFFIDHICKMIDDSVLNEGEKDFNQTVLYGRETDVQTIISVAKRYPMMSSHQVVLVKEAQHLKKIDELLPYIENPQQSTILVICHKYGKIDGRRKIGQLLKKKHVLFEAKKIYDNKIPAWITSYIQSKGYKLSPTASMLLAEHLGSDLSKITNEVEKLFISLPKGTEINTDHIEENIGISKDFNVFELQRALGSRQVVKANQIINYFASDPKNHPPTMVIPILFNYFSNLMVIHTLKDKSQRSVASALSMNPFFVNEFMSASRNYPYDKLFRIIHFLREYDALTKGVGNVSITHSDLMKELIFKILHT
ncbi:MAG: DNA polymerase III subunit delta [Bacteroidetes bacterium]|nr:MAG: DNA polymerase III subunit delta [Bacteroidota bacterium]